jgi:hypothetical protein
MIELCNSLGSFGFQELDEEAIKNSALQILVIVTLLCE